MTGTTVTGRELAVHTRAWKTCVLCFFFFKIPDRHTRAGKAPADRTDIKTDMAIPINRAMQAEFGKHWMVAVTRTLSATFLKCVKPSKTKPNAEG